MWHVCCKTYLCSYTDAQAMQPLTSRDRALIRTQTDALWEVDPGITDELAAMHTAGCKAEIEALYRVTGLAGFASALAEDMRTVLEQLAAEHPSPESGGSNNT